MKRLPKRFIILSPDYIQPHKWSLKIGGITHQVGFLTNWFVNETIAVYSYKKVARKAGHAIAQAQGIGYIEDIKRGELYTRTHRARMFLYDR